MWRKPKPTVRVRLGHAEVTYPDGQVDRVPWTELRGAVAALQPSPAARVRWPRLPQAVRVPWWVGHSIVQRLRARAVAQTLRDGSHDRFWLGAARINSARIAVAAAAATLVMAAVVVFTLRCMGIAPFDPGGIACSPELARSLKGGAVVVSIFLVLLPLAVMLDRRARRRPRVLALRTDAHGVEYHLDDGQRIVQPWLAVLRPKRRWYEAPSGWIDRRGCLPRERSDWLVCERAAVRVHRPETQKRTPAPVRLRKGMTLVFVGTACLPLLIGLVALAAYLAPDPPQAAHGRRPLTPAETLQFGTFITLGMACLFTCAVCTDLGWRAAVQRPWRRLVGSGARRRGD